MLWKVREAVIPAMSCCTGTPRIFCHPTSMDIAHSFCYTNRRSHFIQCFKKTSTLPGISAATLGSIIHPADLQSWEAAVPPLPPQISSAQAGFLGSALPVLHSLSSNSGACQHFPVAFCEVLISTLGACLPQWHRLSLKVTSNVGVLALIMKQP